MLEVDIHWVTKQKWSLESELLAQKVIAKAHFGRQNTPRSNPARVNVSRYVKNTIFSCTL